ncbi:MAG TPA: ABC transporter permease [Gemmatimonadaceae bacterium]|nr:ABC transporter permease [Gemmatimonadaceae bacterium]
MLRYTIRALARSPVFTIVAVLSVGLALTLNTTLFGIVDGVVHPYVPYIHPEQVFVVNYAGGDRQRPVAPANVARAVRDGLQSAQMVGDWTMMLTFLSGGGQAEDGRAVAVSPNVFDILGVRPEAGRGFSANVPASMATQQALISHALWIRFFHGAPLERGLKITVASATYDVIGIMPPGVHFPFATDVWVPDQAIAGDTAARHLGPRIVFRAKPNVTYLGVRHDLQTIMQRIALTYGQDRPYVAYPQSVGTGSPENYTEFRLMLGIVALVLIIACANLGTMMLARGVARRRELAIRVALGASRRTIVSQVLLECAVVVAAGLALGALLMIWAMHVIPHVLTPYVPVLGDLRATPSWRVFGFAAAIAALATMFAGALPALRASRTDPIEPIKEGGASTDRFRDRYNPLIIVEVALSTGLLMASGLFIIFSIRLARYHFHFDATRLITASLRVPADRMTSPDVPDHFYNGMLASMRHVPHVTTVATSSSEGPDHSVIYAEEGKSGDHWMNAPSYTSVSPDYLRTFGIPVIQGRDFAAGDRGGSLPVAIIDAAAAARLFPDLRNPVGHMIKLGDEKSTAPWIHVIGVTPVTEYAPRRDNDLPPEPRVYVLNPHDSERQRELIVRGDGVGGYAGREALSLDVRHEIQDVAPWFGVPNVHPWLQSYDQTRSFTGFLAATLAAFGIFGLVLCAVGLYGVLAYAVARRLREYAIRVALGAQSSDVAHLVLHDTSVTVLAGIGLGAFLGLWGTHAVADALFNVHYEFAIALLSAEVLLVLAGAVACVGPLRRATEADPVEILRAS